MTAPVNTPDQPQWGPPPAGYPGSPGQPPQQARNGLGVAALVVGIIGVLLGIIPFLFWISGTLGVIALTLGLVGHGRARKGQATNKGVALTGTILGGVATVLGIVGLVITVVFVKDVADAVKSEASALPKPPAASSPAGKPGASAPAIEKPLAFGTAHTYPDGVKVTVSKPEAYEPDQYAAGHKKGNKAVQFTVTILNGGNEKLDVTTALANARGADGIEAEAVFDGSMGTKMFSGQLLPGKTAVGKFAFSLTPDTKTVDLQIGPQMLKYDEMTWSGPVAG